MTTSPEHRVVLELSSGDPETWAGALRNAENLRVALGPERTAVAIVAHGKGLGIYLSDKPGLREALGALHAAGVELDACSRTLARLGRGTPLLAVVPGRGQRGGDPRRRRAEDAGCDAGEVAGAAVIEHRRPGGA